LLHQQKTFERLKPHRMLMMRLLARSSNRIAALSERTRRDMVRAFHLRAERTVVVPNVIDPAEFFPSHDRPVERSQMGIARDAFLIGSIGSLNAVKNHPLTLHMLAALRDQGFSFSGYFFGEGKERAFLESMRSRLRLDGFVLMPGNKRPIAPWMRVLDLVVHPSQAEGQPLALLQAIACRVPIIASRIEGNVAVLGDQYPGLFDPNSLYEYQALVSRSIREEAFRNTLLAAQERLLRDLPDALRVARELGRIYTEINPG
jgi:glycosyltransferase EpsD